jgi:hypothetical protein
MQRRQALVFANRLFYFVAHLRGLRKASSAMDYPKTNTVNVPCGETLFHFQPAKDAAGSLFPILCRDRRGLHDALAILD